MPRALRLACPAVNALVGIYEELFGEHTVVLALITVDAIDCAYRHAGGIHTVEAA